MAILVESLKCTGCAACELICSANRVGAMNFLSSSIIMYRAEEKKNYFGPILKTQRTLILGRPEGIEVLALGQTVSGASASAKPIVLREGCDECKGLDGPLCVRVCVPGALSVGEEVK